MRHLLTLLILSLSIFIGSPSAYADHHDRDHGRWEQKHHDKKHDKKHKDKKHKKDKKHHDKRHDRHDKKHYSHPRPGHNGHYAPPPPPHHGHRGLPPRLPHMVRHITKGCHDVNVWRISDDTYIVKYRKGRKFYTRRIYPYADRYGNASLISVNWNPSSPWTLIPPIQLNINL